MQIKAKLKNNRDSYTFIELLLTIGVVAIALGALGGILVSIVKVNQKARVMSELNKNADVVFGRFEEDIRKARDIKCKKHIGDDSTPCIVIDYFVQDSDSNPANDHVELGYIQSKDPALCDQVGSVSPNGYIYYRTYTPDNSEPVESEILTNNDKENGVDVNSVEFLINNTGNSTSVNLNMNISPTLCNNIVNRNKSSKSCSDFVISRID